MKGEQIEMVPVLRTAMWRYHGNINGDNTVIMSRCYGQHCRYHGVMNVDNTVMVPWCYCTLAILSRYE